jgi:hypothetical protein
VVSKRKRLSPPPDAARAAALLEREELLIEQARHLIGSSYRRRCEIEDELGKIRHLLEQLGLTGKSVK